VRVGSGVDVRVGSGVGCTVGMWDVGAVVVTDCDVSFLCPHAATPLMQRRNMMRRR